MVDSHIAPSKKGHEKTSSELSNPTLVEDFLINEIDLPRLVPRSPGRGKAILSTVSAGIQFHQGESTISNGS